MKMLTSLFVALLITGITATADAARARGIRVIGFTGESGGTTIA